MSPTPGEQNRWHLFSIWTTITSRNYRCIQANEFYFIVARSQRLNKLPEWASNPQTYLRAIPIIILSILFKVFTPKYPMSEPSTPGDSTLATLSVFQFTLYFIGGTAHWLNRHRDSLEVIQDFPLNTDQEYYSHCWRKIRALYAKVHLNLSRKVQPSFNFIHGLWS